MNENTNLDDMQNDSRRDHEEEPTRQNLPRIGPEVNTRGRAFVSGNVNANKFVGRYKTVIKEETAYNVSGLPNPYLGMSAFTYANRAAFGGRETSIRAAVKKITTSGSQQTLLFITGASGSGKSSFAQAGLLPALEDYYQERHKQVARAVFRPSSNPLAMLADTLGLLGLPELSPQELKRFAPGEFSRFLDKHTPKNQINLILIDQFEEFFSQSAGSGREIIFNFLTNLAGFQEIHTHVLATLRSDFLQVLFNHPALWNIAKQGVELRAMTAEELKTAIQKPLWTTLPKAAYEQKRFEPVLLEQLAHDASKDAAYLPLLQTTLQELWNRGRLTLGEYKGLAGAIRRRVEIVYKYADYDASQPEKERPPSDQEAILEIMLDLVNVCLDDDPERDVRRRREKVKLVGQDPQRRRLVDDLIQARLLTTGREFSGEKEVETVDIIHESLIMNWGRLQGAIAEKHQTLRQRAVIEQQMGEWLASERSNEYALTGVHLAEARELDIQGDIALQGVDAQAFLRRSRDLVEAAQRRRVRIISLVTASLSLLLLVAIIATGFAWQQRGNSEAARDVAQAAQERAMRARDRAETQANISLARQLAAQAQELFVTQPEKLTPATLLSIESLRYYPEKRASETLAEALEILPRSLLQMTHEGGVNSVTFSPDGKWVASGSLDGTARVWDAATGQEVARMTHKNTVNTVAFSPDGKWVVSGSLDGTARVWDAATGQEVARMTHKNTVNSVAFSPDGQWVASGSGDGTARVWDAAKGQEVARMTHKGEVSSVAFSPDGKWVASGSREGSVRVWEAATGQEAARMTHESWVSSVAFSPDGKWVASGSGDRTARVWDVATGQEVAHMTHEGWVWSVAFSPDGKWVASGSRDGSARVWEAATGQEVAHITHEAGVRSVAFRPDGKLVASGSGDGTARLWDAASGQEVTRMTSEEGVSSVVFSLDGKWLVSGSLDGSARVWAAATGQEGARMTHEGPGGSVYSVAFSPDGKWLASGSDDGSARVWEAATGQEVARMIHEGPVGSVYSVAFSPDGKWLASASLDGTARVWEVATGQEIAHMNQEGPGGLVSSVAFSPDGKWLVSGSRDGTARVWEVDIAKKFVQRLLSGGTARMWEVATGQEVARMTHESWVSSVAFSPDGIWVISGSYDGTVRVWEAATGQEVARMTHEGPVSSVAFSPDGKLLASGGDDGTARVWDAATGQEVTYVNFAVGVYSVVFSPNGKWVASGSDDGSVRVWEAATGQEVARMTHEDSVYSVAFSPNGKWLASGSQNGSIRLWFWNPENLNELACTRLERNLTHDEWKQYLGDRPYRQTCPNLPPGE